jgi:GDP-L-fucose synthase
MKRNSRIFIVGQDNIAAQALLRRLKNEGFTNLAPRRPSGLNIFDQRSVLEFFKKVKPQYCFLPSINEGGIEANIKYPADLIYQNLIVQTNIIHAAWQVKVRRLIFLASSCVYPKDCPQPMKEEFLLTGPLEPTSEQFALAKLTGIKMCQAYNRQFTTQFISAIPATIYGPGDNFDINTSHVIPALMRKFHEAKIKNKPNVVVWGSGRPRREFIFCDDLADACLFLMQQHKPGDLINIGVGSDVSIKRLAELIKEIVGFKGEIRFDIQKPDGIYRKLLDRKNLFALGWRPKVELRAGLEITYHWYLRRQ